MRIDIDEESYQAGYQAGLEGKPNQEPEGMDGYSFCSGYIEGQAAREKIIDQTG